VLCSFILSWSRPLQSVNDELYFMQWNVNLQVLGGQLDPVLGPQRHVRHGLQTSHAAVHSEEMLRPEVLTLKKFCGPKYLLRRPAACSILDCCPRYSLRRPAPRYSLRPTVRSTRDCALRPTVRSTTATYSTQYSRLTSCCDTPALPCSHTSNHL
jgi:hypothetical protein